MMLDNIIMQIFLLLSAISTLLAIFETFGFMDRRITKWLKMNKAEPTIQVLKELGVDIDRVRRANISSQMTEYFDKNNLPKTVENELEKFRLKGPFQIGRTQLATVQSYIDLMGATTDPQNALQFARCLSTHWRNIILDKTLVQNPIFDFVVTPKMGSPILGYEFSKLINKPFAIFTGEDKFVSKEYALKSQLDYTGEIKEKMRALIVDDSTTGGRWH